MCATYAGAASCMRAVEESSPPLFATLPTITSLLQREGADTEKGCSSQLESHFCVRVIKW